MALLKIARMGHPVLTTPAAPVEDPASAEIRRLIADMAETMEDAGGIGLAAPQVHIPLRVVLFFVPEERGGPKERGGAVPLTVLINPEVEPLTGETEEQIEGCLSLPGMVGRVPRFKRIRYRALDIDGRPIEREVEGFHARVVQHEVDHLNATLYPMRMTDLRSFGFVEEVRKGAMAEADPLPE